MTLRQILLSIQAWCRQPQADEPLAERVDQVIPLVKQAADGIRQSLCSKLEDEFRKLLEGSLFAYEGIDECLQEIVSAIRGHRVSVVEEEQVYLKAAMASLRQYTDATESWLSSPYMRCPRCGSKAETPDWICVDCDLEYLYPDPAPSGTANRRFLNLGPEYATVYKTYLGVLAGDVPLAELEEPLLALQEFLVKSLGMAKLTNDPKLLGVLEKIESLCANSLEGVNQMLACFTSREIGDLNDGWSIIFANAGELQKAMPPLLEGLGMKSERPLQACQDTVELSD